MIQDIFNVDPPCCSDKNTAEERQASDDLQGCLLLDRVRGDQSGNIHTMTPKRKQRRLLCNRIVYRRMCRKRSLWRFYISASLSSVSDSSIENTAKLEKTQDWQEFRTSLPLQYLANNPE